jgi:TctA family transporter
MIGCGNDWTIFFCRPVSGAVMIISIGLLFMPFLRGLLKRGRKKGAVQ